MKIHCLKALGLLLVSVALVPATTAAAWPEKSIRVIIPWPPGGSTDIVGRLLAAELTPRLKQQVIIDNRAGAGSIVGLQIATAAPPDGYTFMMTSTAYGFLIDKPKVPVDLVNSFAPVAMIGFGDSALVVHPSLPVRTVKDLVALAKKRPGELFYASSGIGGFPHMNTELFKLKAGVNLVHVPFKGGGPAVADLVAGHSQLQIGSLVTPLGFPEIGPGGGGADIGPIAAAGNVPTMAYLGDASRYFVIHHTAADTIERIAPEEVTKAAAAIAVITYAIAEMPDRLPR